MDQQQGEAVVKVGDTVSDVAAKSEKAVQDKIDQATPVLRDLRESAETAMDKATDLAQQAATAGAETVNRIHYVARDMANQASQAAAGVYQQGARAGGSVSRYAAEQPLTALLVAAAIGYGIAYLIHRP
jgi:ElaB/YqjD/DUF883 family membrane-anchored ribosome-binding protein